MENVTLDVLYKHITCIEKRLNKLEDMLEIPTIKLSRSELKKHKETLKKMVEGKEGVSWEEYKKSKC